MSTKSGDALVAEAIKLRDGWSLFGSKKDRQRDAAAIFIKAAIAFKLEQSWSKAGEAYINAGMCYFAAGDDHDCSKAYNDAAVCYKKVSIDDAIRCLNKSVEIYLDQGRFGIAAKAEKDIAEMCESEYDYEKAIEHYLLAAQYYDTDGSSSAATGVLVKVATLSAMTGKYDMAVENFEKVGKAYASNQMTRFSTRGYLLNAGICKLALGDIVASKRALDDYGMWSHEFNQSREKDFLVSLTEAADEFDVEKFTTAFQNYDSISRLQPWQTTVLLKVKENIMKEEDDLI